MKHAKDLLKRRSEILEKDYRMRLKKLSPKKAIKIEEDLLSSRFMFLLRKNFYSDAPICLRNILRNR
jgi:hypothetical protein